MGKIRISLIDTIGFHYDHSTLNEKPLGGTQALVASLAYYLAAEEYLIKVYTNGVHNYILDITITWPINQKSGFIYDINNLKKIVDNNIISILDHSQIQEDIDWFKNKQPSTENLVLFIWEAISSKISKPAKLYKIKLRETPSIFTEYFGPEN